MRTLWAAGHESFWAVGHESILDVTLLLATDYTGLFFMMCFLSVLMSIIRQVCHE